MEHSTFLCLIPCAQPLLAVPYLRCWKDTVSQILCWLHFFIVLVLPHSAFSHFGIVVMLDYQKQKNHVAGDCGLKMLCCFVTSQHTLHMTATKDVVQTTASVQRHVAHNTGRNMSAKVVGCHIEQRVCMAHIKHVRTKHRLSTLAHAERNNSRTAHANGHVAVCMGIDDSVTISWLAWGTIIAAEQMQRALLSPQ